MVFGLVIPWYPFCAKLSMNTLVQGMPWWIVSKYCGGPRDGWQAVASNVSFYYYSLWQYMYHRIANTTDKSNCRSLETFSETDRDID
jgi:hypothetical protein